MERADLKRGLGGWGFKMYNKENIMGVGWPRLSTSSYSSEFRNRGSFSFSNTLGNPNPYIFRIDSSVQIGRTLLVHVTYPSCKNFEGKKILVYLDASLAALKQQGHLDPHFSDNPQFISPYARFRPNTEGWEDAYAFCHMINSRNN